jgi:hypothetical protein
MGFLKTAFLILLLAIFTSIVMGFIGILADEAPPEVAGTAQSLETASSILRPAMKLEYAIILFVAALVMAGVHALFKYASKNPPRSIQ